MFNTSLPQLSASVAFYKRHCIAPLLITLVCCGLYGAMGDMGPQYLTKAATDGVILYFIFSLNPDRLYYYYNQHVSRGMLVVSFFLFDIIFFSFCLWITTLVT